MTKRFFWFLLAAVLFMVVVGLCGCKTQYIPVETVRTEYREADTTAIYNSLLKLFESRKEKESKSDSTVDREKETVVLNVLGDTVRLTRTHYVYVSSKHEKELEQKVSEQDSIIRDLRTQLSSVKADSIQVPYPVERRITAWETVRLWAFWPLVICVAAIIGWRFLRRRWLIK